MENFLTSPPAQLPDDLRRWAKEMRNEMTDAEALLWKLLRNRRLASAKFRRQHPVGRYILDFYCDEKKLAIELDGGQHQEAAQYDSRRSEWLHAHGIAVLRFWNNEVLMETETVMETIYRVLTTSLRSTALTPSPSPACGRGEHSANVGCQMND